MHGQSAVEAENKQSPIIDHKGQIELFKCDTPLGEAAEAFMQADAGCKTATEAKQNVMAILIDEMKKAGVRTLKFKGDTMQYQPGHVTPDKIKFVPSQT